MAGRIDFWFRSGYRYFYRGTLAIFSWRCLFLNRGRFPSFIFIIGGLLTSSILFYLIIPNPYELTHLPEYAILSILIIKAITKAKEEMRRKLNSTYIYFRSAAITSVLGALDEICQVVLPLRHFVWYHIFLNMLGGLLGLTIFWGVNKR